MDTDAVLTLLQDVADEVINPRFRDLASEEIAEKNPGDLVTVADHEAEALITKALAAAYPDALVLGEEAEASDPTLEERFRAAEHAFTVDPVDGTRNFVHGSPDHAVMVAEIKAGDRGPVVDLAAPAPARRTSPSAARARGATASGWSDRPSATSCAA